MSIKPTECFIVTRLPHSSCSSESKRSASRCQVMEGHHNDTGLNSKPKLSEIQKYVKSRREVTERWEDVGIALGLADEDDGEGLDKIREDRRGDPGLCFNETVKMWQRRCGSSLAVSSQQRTWLTLLSAIKNIHELRAIGEEIEARILADKSTSTEIEPMGYRKTLPLHPASLEASPSTMSNAMESCATNETQTDPFPLSNVERMDTEESVIDYSVMLESGNKVRKYQTELAEPGINGENCIIVAPTGSGKTLVAALVISDHLQKNQLNEESRPRVLFVVNTRPLAEQQKKNIAKFIPNAHVHCSMGDSGPTIHDLLNHNEIIVCTAGKLLDSIKDGKVTFDQISLVVIDECHHTKKRSPQANIMVRYLEHKSEKGSKVPQIMGLTASPGAGDNPNLDPKTTINHLINLCAHLDASGGIVTVKKHQEELDEHTNKPTFTLEISQQRDAHEPFIEMIVSEINECEKFVPFVRCAFPKWCQEYETNVQQYKAPLELSTDPQFRDLISTLRLLRRYSQALNIYMDLRCEDAIGILEKFDGLPSDDSQATPHELKLKDSLHHLIIKLKSLPSIQNPLLKVAEEKIATVFSENPDSKGIFFVRTKKHATSVCKWIESELPSASQLGILPRVLTGHTRETGAGMTQVAQEEVMESFRKGGCNVLVATSVAEEGLDVPACNLVIRFQHVSNEIAKEQTVGRARAEDSEGLTILSYGSKMSLQEMKNAELVKIVEKCISNKWVPSGAHLLNKIELQQSEIVKHHKQLLAINKRKTLIHNASDVQLKCKTCKVTACSGSDIYLLASTHRAVPDKKFQEQKIVKRPHPEPRPLQQAPDFAKTHKIYCAGCDADWGVSVVWPKRGIEIPVLKCKSFIFEVKGRPHSVAKWTEAPFEVFDFSAWLDIQSQSDDL